MNLEAYPNPNSSHCRNGALILMYTKDFGSSWLFTAITSRYQSIPLHILHRSTDGPKSPGSFMGISPNWNSFNHHNKNIRVSICIHCIPILLVKPRYLTAHRIFPSDPTFPRGFPKARREAKRAQTLPQRLANGGDYFKTIVININKIWRFPKMDGTPNHSKVDNFCIESFGDSPF